MKRATLLQRLDTHILTHAPEAWLMKAHWIAAGSLLVSVAFAAVALALPVTLTDYPHLYYWPEITRVLFGILVAGWAWRYLSRVSEFHASLQWGATKLFTAHLLCILALVAPFRVLPTVLIWRFDHLDFKTLDNDMRRHKDACSCLFFAYEGPRVLELQDDRLRLGSVLCRVWTDSEITFVKDHRCGTRDDALLSAAADSMLQIHEKYLADEEMDVERTLGYWDYSSDDESKHLYNARWRQEAGLPAYMRAVNNLWHAWCRQSKGGVGYCAEPAHDGSPTREIERLRAATVVEAPTVWPIDLIYGGLLSCLFAMTLTALRYRRGTLFLLTLSSALFVVWILSQLTAVRYGLEKRIVAQTDAVTAAFAISLALALIGRWRGWTRGWRGRSMDTLAALGCCLAPLIPLLWITWLDPEKPHNLSPTVAHALFEYFLYPSFDEGKSGAKILELLQIISDTHFYGLPLHWVWFFGSVACTLLASWALMNVWRARNIAPP